MEEFHRGAGAHEAIMADLSIENRLLNRSMGGAAGDDAGQRCHGPAGPSAHSFRAQPTSLSKLTPAIACFGLRRAERERIPKQTSTSRRLQHCARAGRPRPRMEQTLRS